MDDGPIDLEQCPNKKSKRKRRCRMPLNHHNHAGHHHDHTHHLAKHSLRTAFLLTVIILVVELVGGVLAHSLALISDAGHVVTDLFALGLAWFAAIQAERPSNERKTFGYHRVGILAALLNAITLVLIAVMIAWEALQRIRHPEPIQPYILFAAAAVGIAVNLFIGFGLRKEGDSLNVRAAMLHVFGDVGVSAGVIVAGIIIVGTGWTIVDPLLSIAIALFIIGGAWSILRETTDILLESVPRDISIESLVRDMKAVTGVQGIHDLHVWSIASGMHTLSCHVLIDDLPPSNSSSILQSLTRLLNDKYQISHSTIQFECKALPGACCEKHDLYCQLDTSRESSCQHDH